MFQPTHKVIVSYVEDSHWEVRRTSTINMVSARIYNNRLIWGDYDDCDDIEDHEDFAGALGSIISWADDHGYPVEVFNP